MWVSIWRKWAQFRPFFKILFFAVLGLGVYLGIQSGPSGGYGSIAPLLHAGGLFSCTVLSYLGYPRWRWWFRGGLVFGAGVGIEAAQYFNPRRNADVTDLYYNAAGVVAALLLIWAWRAWNHRRNLRYLKQYHSGR
jgi:VanZ family protein